MINKGTFTHFFDNIYFKNGEKKQSYIIITGLENNLDIEIISPQGLYLKLSYPSVDDGDIITEETNKSSNIIMKLSDFEKEIKTAKARNKLCITFSQGNMMINEYIKQANDEKEVVISHFFMGLKKSVEDLNLDYIPGEMTETIELENRLADAKYLSNVSITDMKEFDDFNNITIRQLDNHLLFLTTAGAALHCCKISGEKHIFDEILKMSPVYMKNLVAFQNKLDCMVSFGYTKNMKKPIIRFSNGIATVQNEVEITDVDYWKNIENNFIEEHDFSTYTLDLNSSKEWKAFIKNETKFRKEFELAKLESMIKLSLSDDTKTANIDIVSYKDIDTEDDTVYMCSFDFIKLYEDTDTLFIFKDRDKLLMKSQNKFIYI